MLRHGTIPNKNFAPFRAVSFCPIVVSRLGKWFVLQRRYVFVCRRLPTNKNPILCALCASAVNILKKPVSVCVRLRLSAVKYINLFCVHLRLIRIKIVGFELRIQTAVSTFLGEKSRDHLFPQEAKGFRNVWTQRDPDHQLIKIQFR